MEYTTYKSNKISNIINSSYNQNIVSIDFSNNNLQYINSLIFTNLVQIKYIDLSNNSIKYVTKMPKLYNLTEIILSNNNIKKFNNVTNNVVNLQSLVISENKISSINIKNSRLINLDISFNRLNIIKKYTFENTMNLVNLNISNNLIKLIDEYAFINNLKLRILNISSNRINTFGNVILLYLQNLEILNISFNNIDFISSNIITLNKLKMLYINNTKIIEITNLNKFNNLKFVYLFNNIENIYSLLEIKVDNIDIECSICFDNNCNITLSKCNHKFHDKCIIQWFINNKTCPMCRTSIYKN